MPKTVRWLGALLAVQIVMAVGFNLSTLWPSAQPGAAPLIEVVQNQINRIVLEGPDHTKVVLVKEGETWLLPEREKFPAASNRVNTLLGKILGSKPGAPIAVTSGAKTRFKVSNEAFERRMTLAQNDKTLATLYLGSSLGPRRSYVRADGHDAIFALELAAYEMPVQLADWEDKTILQFQKTDIKALEVAGLRLEQSTQSTPPSAEKETDEQPQPAVLPLLWVARELNVDRRVEINPDAVEKLNRLLSDLTFDKVLGRDLTQEYGLAKPLLTITLSRKTGDTMTYLLGKNPKKDDYTLKVSTHPEYFRLPSYQATALIEAADRKQLLNTATAVPALTKS
ncbi:hypothetical protein YTPLAS72_06860 [Nitrospira sp.]|nr:hypothetical protein YTPLAS72_06860 [Nitrospira sp.]